MAVKSNAFNQTDLDVTFLDTKETPKIRLVDVGHPISLGVLI